MWFKKLTGFNERSPENVRANLDIDGDSFISKVNGQRFTIGTLEISTLEELAKESPALDILNNRISVSEVVANVTELHMQVDNSNALFQAASQFNLLEMVAPSVPPEYGVDRYENDHTQGPACAIACGAGTIYRNYFVPLDSQIRQSARKQVDCLALIGEELDNEALGLWRMKNGYALISQEGLLSINKKLSELSHQQRESLKDKLKVGIQWDTEVTISDTKHKVSQVYCSALPVAYSNIESIYWESFARLILEATYEATLYTALLNLERNKSNLVYLTLVGGGAFGNDMHWILDSLKKTLIKFKNAPLDVRVVSYGSSNPNLLSCINEFAIFK